jgi:hypothetical protein
LNALQPLSKAKAEQASGATTASTPTDRFRLLGPTIKLDRRVHAVRPDIADVALAGRLFAPHYAEAQPRRCTATFTMVRSRPDATAQAVSQLLLGEDFAVLDIASGWAWGYCVHDHYVGYVPADALDEPVAPTHIVTAPLALVFAEPDIKSPVSARWPMGARFAGEERDGFVACDAGYLHPRHAGPTDLYEADPVAVAERFVGAPYLWGGRGGGGVDCSGLIQMALGRAGIAVPRDTDQQLQADLGTDIPSDAPLRRADLIFFPAHVGLMIDAERVIHANAYTMDVTIEPLADLVARLTPHYDRPITGRRRLHP